MKSNLYIYISIYLGVTERSSVRKRNYKALPSLEMESQNVSSLKNKIREDPQFGNSTHELYKDLQHHSLVNALGDGGHDEEDSLRHLPGWIAIFQCCIELQEGREQTNKPQNHQSH